MKKMNTYKYLLAATVTTAAIVSVVPTANAITFTDVDQLGNASYEKEIKDAVYNLANRGIVKGISDNKFAPNAPITRAEAATIIAQALKLPTTNVANPNFKDVKTTDWYYPYVAALSNAKIINGYNGYFNPSNKITRADMATIIATAYGLKAKTAMHPFKDLPENHYANPFITALYDNGVAYGTTATTYNYLSNVTRAQLAVFTVRAEKATGGQPDSETPTNVGKSITLKAADYGFMSFSSPSLDGSNIYSATLSNGQLQITALNEGQGKILLKGTSSNGSNEAFYLVNVEKINGQMQVALEKANMLEYLDYNSQYFTYKDLNVGFTPAIATLKKSGKAADEAGSIDLDEAGFDITLYDTGTYTLTLENGPQTKTLTVEVKLNRFVTVIDIQ